MRFQRYRGPKFFHFYKMADTPRDAWRHNCYYIILHEYSHLWWKFLLILTSGCRENHESSVWTNKQTNRQTDPNAIPSPLVRVTSLKQSTSFNYFSTNTRHIMKGRTEWKAKKIMNLINKIRYFVCLSACLSAFSRFCQDSWAHNHHIWHTDQVPPGDCPKGIFSL